jgi:UDP-glucose 4-epimerase
MSIKILVTGGLGYIGSHTIVSLKNAGFMPVIVDNLSNTRLSVLDEVSDLLGYKPIFIEGDVRDEKVLESIFIKYNIQAVIHFAALKSVGESVKNPLLYYQNNVIGLISLLHIMQKFKCNNMIFSSSCTVYGEPELIPVAESLVLGLPTSPYGATKQIAEQILTDNAWCNVQCLRYFNPVGAHESAKIGELPLGIPNNLVPFLTQTAAGIHDKLVVYGGDYATPDGTCIRDYIHVMDLADAHVIALKNLFLDIEMRNSKSENEESERIFQIFNLGTGLGYSVLEVIQTFEEISNIKVKYEIGARRKGDIVSVWADTNKAEKVLGWNAKRDLKCMMKDAWNWQKQIISKNFI